MCVRMANAVPSWLDGHPASCHTGNRVATASAANMATIVRVVSRSRVTGWPDTRHDYAQAGVRSCRRACLGAPYDQPTHETDVPITVRTPGRAASSPECPATAHGHLWALVLASL